MYSYLIFNINLNLILYSLLYFRYFRLTMFIIISLFLIYTLNIKSLFNVLLIFSIGYIIFNFCYFLGVLYFINLFAYFPFNTSPVSLSPGSQSEHVNNYNLLDDLLDKGANALLKTELYSSTKYTPSLFVSFFNILFGIANKTMIYIPSAFQNNTIPDIINVKLGLINKSPILIEVLKLNFKIVGGASPEGESSSLPVLLREPLLSNFPDNSVGDFVICKYRDKVPAAIREQILADSGLCSVIIDDKQKNALLFLLSTLVEKSSNFVCFQKDYYTNSKLRIFNCKDIFYNDIEYISVYYKLGDYPDRASMCEGANKAIYEIILNIPANLRENSRNLH